MGRTTWLAALCLVMGGCSSNTPSLSDAQAGAIREGVEVTLDRFRAYSDAGQWDSLATLYLDGSQFRWVEDGAVRYRSAGEIQRALAEHTASLETTLRDTEIMPLSPGVASLVTHFNSRIVDSTGYGFDFGGIITMTLVARADGWRIFGGHTSTERNPAPYGAQGSTHPD